MCTSVVAIYTGTILSNMNILLLCTRDCALVTQCHPASILGQGKSKPVKLEEALNMMAAGFCKGGTGFLKSTAGEMVKGGGTVNREIRVGVTHVSFYDIGCFTIKFILKAQVTRIYKTFCDFSQINIGNVC